MSELSQEEVGEEKVCSPPPYPSPLSRILDGSPANVPSPRSNAPDISRFVLALPSSPRYVFTSLPFFNGRKRGTCETDSPDLLTNEAHARFFFSMSSNDLSILSLISFLSLSFSINPEFICIFFYFDTRDRSIIHIRS